MLLVIVGFGCPPPFLSSSLFHEHTHKTFLCSSLSHTHTHTQLFGCHLSYVILNSRATCFTASSERVMTGGWDGGREGGRSKGKGWRTRGLSIVQLESLWKDAKLKTGVVNICILKAVHSKLSTPRVNRHSSPRRLKTRLRIVLAALWGAKFCTLSHSDPCLGSHSNTVTYSKWQLTFVVFKWHIALIIYFL